MQEKRDKLGVAQYNSDEEHTPAVCLVPADITTTTPSHFTQRKGKRRVRYSVQEKVKVIKEIDSEVNELHDLPTAVRIVAAKHQIPYNTAEKWVREEKKDILVKLSKQKKFNKRKKKVNVKKEGIYPKLEAELIELARAERGVGSAIGIKWMIHKAKDLNKSYKYVDARFTRHWISNVLSRNDGMMRAPQNTRKEGVNASIPKILQFHQSLHKFVRLNTAGNTIDLISLNLYIYICFFNKIYVYGRYPPEQRWNVDQVPLVFASKPRRVVHFKDIEQVWVSTPSAGLQKRQCSLILTINGSGVWQCVWCV